MQTEIRSHPTIPVQQHIPAGVYRKYVKRLIDVILSTCAIIVFLPVLLAVSLLVKLMLGSPVIFKQDRVGLNEKIFTIYKFRTMTDAKSKTGELLPDEVRLTKLGQFLRSSSIDELPEFLNVLKGDMSLIGPRPLLLEYLPLYNESQKRRHLVRPGLSGLAQVNGRNAISWEDKFNLDVQYVDNVNIIDDCKIIFLTVKNVLLRKGINSDTAATMEPFRGSSERKCE